MAPKHSGTELHGDKSFPGETPAKTEYGEWLKTFASDETSAGKGATINGHTPTSAMKFMQRDLSSVPALIVDVASGITAAAKATRDAVRAEYVHNNTLNALQKQGVIDDELNEVAADLAKLMRESAPMRWGALVKAHPITGKANFLDGHAMYQWMCAEQQAMTDYADVAQDCDEQAITAEKKATAGSRPS